MRGPRWSGSFCARALRLIPAGAGTTSHRGSTRALLSAHPRRCGDHASQSVAIFLPWGSSPQVRGPLEDRLDNHSNGGLIPAGAGTTVDSFLICALGEAHPRRCGDHSGTPLVSRITAGSSPQVRGPRSAVMSWGGRKGLIPAGAGTTILYPDRSKPLSAHPRRCGDHFTGYHVQEVICGSSPQVRGPPLVNS